MPTINSAGLDLIKQFEGLALTAYRDPGGIWTIGYGHTGPVNGQPIGAGMVITEATALDELAKDLTNFERGVNDLLAHDVNPNQFAALVSLAFNIGLEALAGSTLLRYVNAGEYDEAAKQFSAWVYDDGEVLAGLVRRRLAEQQLFETPG